MNKNTISSALNNNKWKKTGDMIFFAKKLRKHLMNSHSTLGNITCATVEYS